MKKLLKNLKPKVIIAMFFLATLGLSTILLANQTNASTEVEVESEAGISNGTSGDGKFHPNVTAKVDDVVKVEVWYHNKMNQDSGLIGKDFNVKINIPGDSSQVHNVTTTVGGSNTNTITKTVSASTQIPTNLQYIPGTAYRKYNKGTNQNVNIVEEKISDSVVTSGFVIPGGLKPCWNFDETITVEARVIAPVVAINKKERIAGTSTWTTDMTAKPGDTIEYYIEVRNAGNTKLNNVIVRDSFPPRLDYLEGSAKMKNTLVPNGVQISDNLINGGVNIGNLLPGANTIIYLNAKVPQTTSPTGNYTFTNVGVVKSDELHEFYNTAIVKVNFPGVTVVPEPECTLSANPTTVFKGDKTNLTWTTKNVNKTTIDQGIGDVSPVSGGTVQSKQLFQDTKFTLTATGNNSKVITCTANVTVKEKPTTPPTTPPTEVGKGQPSLPVSGPAEAVAGTLGGISLAGAASYYRKTRKALGNAFKKF